MAEAAIQAGNINHARENIIEVCVTVCSLSCVYGQPGYTDTLNTQLTSRLWTGYDKWSRPSSSMVVYIGLSLTNINSLDTVNQVLDTTGTLALNWMDYRLSWNLSEFNMSYTFVTVTKLWIPPLIVFNDVEGQKIFGDNSDLQSERLFVSNDGLVVWPHPVHIRSHCDVNIRFYPFDIQTCKLEFGVWGLPIDIVRLQVIDHAVDTSVFMENGEWALLDSFGGPKLLSSCTVRVAQFELRLQREQSYYILNILLPVAFLAVLGPVAFILPVESGEKAGFSLTVLLSLSVVMNLVSDKIPTTSTHVCYLSVYLLVTYVVCVIEVLMTTLTLRMYNFHETGCPLPSWINTLIRKYLTKMLCYGKHHVRQDTNNKTLHQNQAVSTISRENTVHTRTGLMIGEVDEEVPEDLLRNNIDSSHKLPNLDNKIKPHDVTHDERYTYKDACILLDNLNLILFEFITLIVTLTFFISIS